MAMRVQPAEESAVRCNVCGHDEFIDMNTRKGVRCAVCGSLERTRLVWLYLQKLDLQRDARILHLAPEKGLHDALVKRVEEGNYRQGDINPKLYPFASNISKVDLCDLDHMPSGEYDLILHSHVLEHTPCNIAYTLYHLHRMLKEDGHHVFIVPFMPGRYDECFQEIGDAERTRRFGQFDHVRMFGTEDIPAHLGSLLEMAPEFDATRDFPESALREANIPESNWRGYHPGTVMMFGKYDMKLLKP